MTVPNGDLACNALAACEVLARVRGSFGYRNEYAEKVDLWIERCKPQIPEMMIDRALSAIDRILAEHSELKQLFEERGRSNAWLGAISDLRQRLAE